LTVVLLRPRIERIKADLSVRNFGLVGLCSVTDCRAMTDPMPEGDQMQQPLTDLRSDTVTRPTPEMRRAMADAEVGDDVLGDDPTVKVLEERTAELLGKEAALFVPSGSMANQIGVGVNTQPGDEVLCSRTSHVYQWEAGGIARLSGVTARTFDGDHGLLSLEDLRDAVRPLHDVHYVRTRLVCLENTHNRGGGRVHPIESIAEIGRWAREHNLAMHLDGARLMNAVVASGRHACEWAQHFDTVSICFSKGLGAPIGSAVAGSTEAIRRARRLRKLFGGAMRQVGIIAAGALYALEHHVERLSEDHAHARILADAFAGTEGFSLDCGPVETNLVWVAVHPTVGTAADVAAYLRSRNILVSAIEGQVLRACTHLDVSRDQVEYTAEVIRQIEPALVSAMTLVY
jgi:threonine aldolase